MKNRKMCINMSDYEEQNDTINMSDDEEQRDTHLYQ